MSRLLDYRGWILWLGLVAGVQSASAFSMLGPAESWQTSTLGYERVAETRFPNNSFWIIFFGDFSAFPKNLGEEYRWNQPVLYYAYDQSFLDYFGSNGVAAVDAAVAILNRLTNVSSYSEDLSELPLREARVNFTASALHLYDLKSAALELLVERLGLADPDHWTWCLRSRILPPGLSCPRFDYAVVQRNFDPVTLAPSRYVNGNLFTYAIEQSCQPDFGDADEFVVDPTDIYLSAVASPKISYPRSTYYGYFHTSLTRDDVGGLRYLYRRSNENVEAAGAGTLTYVTDTNTTQALFTSNLTVLATQALTNNAAALQALYPDLSIASTTTIFTNIWITNLTAYFTNFPFDPIGTPQHLAFATNRTLTVQTWFHHTFNNVVEFQLINNVWTAVPLPDIVNHTGIAAITVQTTTVTNAPWTPAGTPLITNVTTVTYLTNQVVGGFFIVPTNLCGLNVTALQATLDNFTTNVVASATNATANFTNAFTQVVIEFFPQNVFLANPILCVSNSVARRQGIEKVSFVRRDYDSLVGQFFYPITNYYTLTAVTNHELFPQRIQRVVTRPDILFRASDLAGAFPYIPTVARSAPNYSTNGVLQDLVGPGNIEGPVSISFNKVGPIYLNGTYPFFIDELGSVLDFIWGSFDGSTNAPIVYPIGTSIYNLENQVLIQISPFYLPAGAVGQPYQAQLQTVGATPNWTAPFTWSLAPGSFGLPPGLGISAAGLISGTPTAGGFYDFVVRVTDGLGRTAQRSYSINLTGLP
jgi:hypothetical protein